MSFMARKTLKDLISGNARQAGLDGSLGTAARRLPLANLIKRPTSGVVM